MLELDLLLQGFLERGLADLCESERAAFDALLRMQDNDLLALLYGEVEPQDEETAHVVDAVRRAASP
jgi:antitoxin CptB